MEERPARRRISSVEAGDYRVLGDSPAGKLRESLVGRRFESRHRYGNIGIEGGGRLSMRFGMGEKKPQHVRLLLGLEDRSRLAFTDQRPMARAHPVENPESSVRQKGLGPNALRVDYPSFRSAVKSVPMNLHPRAGVAGLEEANLERLFAATRDAPQNAVDRGANPKRSPRPSCSPAGAKKPAVRGETAGTTR
ncbi:hypothetical protein RxyAA322_11150 [Rubrobacter xylanophilus]|uniref:Uncharacterized protein n=2 Tax=Rubrobacter xylanophilus TaxID=49319 RepID=A0A510HH32_9ACTN|nr:hypothetical protein RxyAA322_11150 [Rubrobacter xylanophilus]